MKVIEIITNKGTFELMVDLVVQNYAYYISMHIDNQIQKNNVYEYEIKKILNDNDLILNWLLNYTQWEDWEDLCILINDFKSNDKNFWEDPSNFNIRNDHFKNDHSLY